MLSSVVILSPHSDDAALSAAALFARGDKKPKVVTIFSKSAWSRTGGHAPDRVKEITARRRREDSLAMQRLGAGVPSRLNLKEAPLRHYRSMADILGDKIDPSDFDTIKAVAKKLKAVLTQPRSCILVAPLGLGGHVDHLIVREVARATKTGGLAFYEDLPYAAILKHRGTLSRTISRNVRRSGRPLVQSLTLSLHAAEFQVKLEALRHYRSQLTENDFALVSYHAERTAKPYGERFHFEDNPRGRRTRDYLRIHCQRPTRKD